MRRLKVETCWKCGKHSDECMCDSSEFEKKELDMRSHKEREEDERIEQWDETCLACGKKLEDCTCNNFEDEE